MLGMRRRRFISRLRGAVRLLRIRVLGMQGVRVLGLGRGVGRCGRLMLLLGGGFEGRPKRREKVRVEESGG